MSSIYSRTLAWTFICGNLGSIPDSDFRDSEWMPQWLSMDRTSSTGFGSQISFSGIWNQVIFTRSLCPTNSSSSLQAEESFSVRGKLENSLMSFFIQSSLKTNFSLKRLLILVWGKIGLGPLPLPFIESFQIIPQIIRIIFRIISTQIK